jgi:hypothetical protein
MVNVLKRGWQDFSQCIFWSFCSVPEIADHLFSHCPHIMHFGAAFCLFIPRITCYSWSRCGHHDNLVYNCPLMICALGFFNCLCYMDCMDNKERLKLRNCTICLNFTRDYQFTICLLFASWILLYKSIGTRI